MPPREPLDVSDDEYDLISNPDSSIAELTPRAVYEPQPTVAARNQFNTACLSAGEIQAFIKSAIGAAASLESRNVRIYVDGSWDTFNVSHALTLRQAKLSFPRTSLLVGVFTDTDCKAHNLHTAAPFVERAEVVRHCRWVDDVLPDAPWQINMEFCKLHRIDFVAVLEGTSVDPFCDKDRLKGYDEMKAQGKVIPVRRTTGLYQPATYRPIPPPSDTLPIQEPEDDDSPFRQIDQYGIGF